MESFAGFKYLLTMLEECSPVCPRQKVLPGYFRIQKRDLSCMKLIVQNRLMICFGVRVVTPRDLVPRSSTMLWSSCEFLWLSSAAKLPCVYQLHIPLRLTIDLRKADYASLRAESQPFSQVTKVNQPLCLCLAVHRTIQFLF